MSANTNISRRFLSAGLFSASLLTGAAFAQTSASTSPNQTFTSDLGGLVACADSVVDQNGTGCMQANTVPTLGMLYPLSVDLFVDMVSGFVGLGTISPDESLQIGEFFQTARDNYIELRTTGGFGSEFRQGMKMRSSNPFFGFDIEHDDELKGLNMLRYDNDFGTSAGASTLFLDRENGNVGLGTVDPIADFSIENRIWTGVNVFGLNESTVMTTRADELRAAYMGPLSAARHVIGMHRSDGVFIGGGIVQDDDLDEVSIFADVKNFRETNPRNPNTDIVYACIEGPEAAAYVRGTADLIGGMAHIELPEHFSDVAMTDGMTVHVTPRSAASRGLAVVERTKTHIVVAELMNGQGSYQFDWEVKGVRAKYENYQVVRPKLRSPLLPATHQQR